MTSVRRAVLGDHRDPAEELTEIFGGPSPEQAAVTWGTGVLVDAGVPAEDPLRAIGALRRAEPRLGLRTATYIAGLLTR